MRRSGFSSIRMRDISAPPTNDRSLASRIPALLPVSRQCLGLEQATGKRHDDEAESRCKYWGPEFESQGHGTAGAMTSGVASIGSTLIHHAPGGMRRMYWRAIWLLGAGCLRAWLLAIQKEVAP